MTKETFPQWLLTEINERGWSQGELARRAGITQGAVSHILGGMRSPGPEFCKAVAKALGYPPEVVFRKAGILPPKPPQNEETEIALHLLNQLPPEKRQAALQFLKFLAQQESPPLDVSSLSNKKRAGTPALER